MTVERSANVVQRYRYIDPQRSTESFMLNYRYRACKPGIRRQD